MSDELKAEIDALRAANAKLTKDLGSLTDELKETRAEARDRRHEAKSLTQQVAELAGDRDQWKARAETDPDGLKAQLMEAADKVRALKHERAYEKVARGLKVSDPTKLGDLLKLAGHTPEGDEPDEARIAATFQEALKDRPWLVDVEARAEEAPGGATPAPGGANGAKTTETAGKAGPGADRGQSLSERSSQAPPKPGGRL